MNQPRGYLAEAVAVVPPREAFLELLEHLEQILAFRDRAGRISLRKPDHAFLVDDEGRARVHAALFIENAVRLADRAVRPVIRHQWKWNAAQALSPRFQAGQRIGADLQDFNIELLEFVVVRTEPGDLILSPTGERERQKRDHRLLAAEAAEAERLVEMRGKR